MATHLTVAVWTKVVERPTGQHCHPQSHATSMADKISYYQIDHSESMVSLYSFYFHHVS